MEPNNLKYQIQIQISEQQPMHCSMYEPSSKPVYRYELTLIKLIQMNHDKKWTIVIFPFGKLLNSGAQDQSVCHKDITTNKQHHQCVNNPKFQCLFPINHLPDSFWNHVY